MGGPRKAYLEASAERMRELQATNPGYKHTPRYKQAAQKRAEVAQAQTEAQLQARTSEVEQLQRANADLQGQIAQMQQAYMDLEVAFVELQLQLLSCEQGLAERDQRLADLQQRATELAQQAADDAEQRAEQLAALQQDVERYRGEAEAAQAALNASRLSKDERDKLSLLRRAYVSASHLRKLISQDWCRAKPGPKPADEDALPPAPAGPALKPTQTSTHPKAPYVAEFLQQIQQLWVEHGISLTCASNIIEACVNIR